MGLIARAIEAEGIPTLSMTSAHDITRAAWPPRAAFLDYPLGHTAGRAHAPELNLAVLRDTFAAFEHLSVPGALAYLRYRWSDTDRWKDRVFTPTVAAADLPECAAPSSDQAPEAVYVDDRIERHTTPQYQTDEDAYAAQASHDGKPCSLCAGIDY